MQTLYNQGKLLYAGAFLDNSGGLAMVKVASDSELRELIANEPATLDQVFTVETHPWYLSFDAARDRSLFCSTGHHTKLACRGYREISRRHDSGFKRVFMKKTL
jgi:hypothetical protein